MNDFWQGFEKRASTRWGRELADSLGKSIGIGGVTPKMLSLGRKMDRIKKRPTTPYEKRKGRELLPKKVPDTAFQPNNNELLRTHMAKMEPRISSFSPGAQMRSRPGANQIAEQYNKTIYNLRPDKDEVGRSGAAIKVNALSKMNARGKINRSAGAKTK